MTTVAHIPRPVPIEGMETTFRVERQCYRCETEFQLEQDVKFVVAGVKGIAIAYLLAAHANMEDCRLDERFNPPAPDDADPVSVAGVYAPVRPSCHGTDAEASAISYCSS